MDEIEGWLPDLTDMPLSELRESQDPVLLRAIEEVKKAAEEPPMVQEWYD